MTRVEIHSDELVLTVLGLDRLFAFTSELRIPLAHVAGVGSAIPETRNWWHGFHLPGTFVLGLITAGTFYESDGRAFWDVHDPEMAIKIVLHDERYVKLVVEVADPAATIAEIDAALDARRPSRATSSQDPPSPSSEAPKIPS